MGVRILEGVYDGTTDAAVLVDSVTNMAFGPLWESADEAAAFLAWCDTDPRRVAKFMLEDLVRTFLAERETKRSA